MEKISLFLILFSQSNYDLPSIYKKNEERVKNPNFVENVVLKIIDFYQESISDIQGELCNFYPSCSRFTEQAIIKHGFIKGILLGFDRIQRDHPFTFRYLIEYYGIHITRDKKIKAYDPVEKYIKYERDYIFINNYHIR
jgi:hypothetical protein